MNIELTDELIRDTLIEHKVITKKRVMDCGRWKTKKVGYDRHINKSYQSICNDLVCRVCRKRRRNIIRTRHYIQNQSLIDKGGETLLLTLTIPHSAKDTLNDLYKRFRTSLTQMKKGWIWRKLKRKTGMEYHYDTIEITKNDNGFHLHAHITLGCFGNTLSIFDWIIPEQYSIHNIYPNPFNPVTNITYGLPEYTKVNIIIYDLSGKQVQSLVNGFQGPGYHSVDWNADNYSSGMYLVRMYTNGSTFGEYVSTQKILLIK